MNVFAIIYIVGVFQGFLLSFVLLTSQNGNRISNRILAVFLTLISIVILSFVLEDISFFKSFPQFYFIKAHIFFLLGPLFYFYVKSNTTFDFRFRSKNLFHLIPFFLFFLIVLPFYFQNYESMKSVVMSKESLGTTQLSVGDLIIQGIFKSYNLAYLLFSLQLLKQFNYKIKDAVLSDNRTKYKWLKKIIIIILIISTISMIIDFFPEQIPIDVFTPLATTVTILFMGYIGLKQSEILSMMEFKKPEKKYKKSALTPEVSENIYQSLIKLMNSDKIYTDSEISLPKLAKEMNVAQHHLSQVINERFNLNFFGLINKFRIEEAKKLLLESNNNKMNVSEIAYHVGFNSISAFNSAFKKFTEVSPLQFKNKIQKTNKTN